MRLLAVALMLIAACGPTSYEEATAAHPVAPNRWIVEVRGKRIGPALMLEYQQRKAGEVCPTGFTVEQTTGGTETTGYIVNSQNGTAVPIRRMNAAAVVLCN